MKPKERREQEWLVEMIRRSADMRTLAKPPRSAKLKPPYPFSYDTDTNLFEAAMDGLQRSDLHPENGFVPEAIPGFAALLTRVIEQVAAEFGLKAAYTALYLMAQAMEDQANG